MVEPVTHILFLIGGAVLGLSLVGAAEELSPLTAPLAVELGAASVAGLASFIAAGRLKRGPSGDRAR